MSTKANSLVPAATRAIASAGPLAILVETARPSELKKPLVAAITKGAALASIGRSKENMIAIGGRTSAAARLSVAPQQAKPSRPISEAKMQRTAMVGLARMGDYFGSCASCHAGYVGFMTPASATATLSLMKPERARSATILQPAFGIREPKIGPVVVTGRHTWPRLPWRPLSCSQYKLCFLLTDVRPCWRQFP